MEKRIQKKFLQEMSPTVAEAIHRTNKGILIYLRQPFKVNKINLFINCFKNFRKYFKRYNIYNKISYFKDICNKYILFNYLLYRIPV